MEALIPVINELQSVFKSTGYGEIDLPQIVVVGSQSCGKSSVLESLVGRSFLPRGSGIVTRCPIILQLSHVFSKDENGNSEWCVFKKEGDEGEDEIYTDYDEVRKAIEKRTEDSAGTNRGISMTPIIVRVYSPHIVSLTVVDLPGIVKVPVGDQPADIEDQVHEMIIRYINNENALILAVSPANADIATSESIKIANSVDPTGDRTLAVVTKLDLMDKGTDAMKVLNGDIIKVKLGIYGVVNRSQEDIDNNKSIEKAMEDEKAFLLEKYPSKFDVVGSDKLAYRLNELLQRHISRSLPGLVTRIKELTTAYERQRDELGPEIEQGKGSHWVLTQTLANFTKDYESKVEGRNQFQQFASSKRSKTPGQFQKSPLKNSMHLGKSLRISQNTKPLGTKIISKFNAFGDAMKRQHTLMKNSNSSLLEDAIQETVNFEGFTSIEDVFKALARSHVEEMEELSLECADSIHNILIEAVKDSLKDKRLEKLNGEISRVARKLLNTQLQATKKSIKEYIEIQVGMTYSRDEKFLGSLGAKEDEEEIVDFGEDLELSLRIQSLGIGNVASKANQKGASFPLTSIIANTRNQCDYVKNLVNVYVDVMCRQISDYIPKHIMFHLYRTTMENIPDEIIKSTAGKENDLIQENEAIVHKRRETNAMLQNLYKAYEIVNGIESNINNVE